ncbi:hypothetical protein SLS56_001810 [Neofusicoccum ribis]|uniref:Uncharacterized protein n=1 Tax=Neofusicoccum ribis TaxID=45134 RepID=A0ABR3T786_9PEZI
MSSAMSLERSRSSNPAEPSRFIYISGLRNPRPLSELRHWFSRGRHIYDELRVPVVPCSVGGAGPDRLATSASSGHPTWESTLPDHDAEELLFVEEHLKKQVAEIEAIEALVELEEAEKAKAEEEEERLDEEEKKKKEIRANTWKGSRGKYGNESGAKPHTFPGRVGSPDQQQQQQQQAELSRHLPALLSPPVAGLERQASQPFLDPAMGNDAFPSSPVQSFNHLTTAHPFPAAVASDTLFNHNGVHTFPQQQQQAPRAQPQHHRAAPLHLNTTGIIDNSPDWWTQPSAATPAMSVLSPRAVSFVPAGLFSPEAQHVVPCLAPTPAPALVIADGRPQQQQQQSYFRGHRARPSNLNPTAGDFRPGAMVPTGPKGLQRGGGVEK